MNKLCCDNPHLITTADGIICFGCKRAYDPRPAAPPKDLYKAPGAVTIELDYERAQIHPLIGKLCVQFMNHVVPQLENLGQRSRRHKEIAARAFFQGAYELQVYADGKMDHATADGSIDDSKPQGALALFVGGAMFRGGAYNAVKHNADKWGPV